MANADDRDAGFVQQLSIAANVEKQRRIVDFLPAGWVTRVIDGENSDACSRRRRDLFAREFGRLAGDDRLCRDGLNYVLSSSVRGARNTASGDPKCSTRCLDLVG